MPGKDLVEKNNADTDMIAKDDGDTALMEADTRRLAQKFDRMPPKEKRAVLARRRSQAYADTKAVTDDQVIALCDTLSPQAKAAYLFEDEQSGKRSKPRK